MWGFFLRWTTKFLCLRSLFDFFEKYLPLETKDPTEKVKWYEVNAIDQGNIYTPTLSIEGSKSISRTGKSGANDKDYFWYNHFTNLMDYRQALKSTIYCSFDFKGNFF